MNLFGFDDRPVHIAVAGRSDPGRTRADNQDNFLVADLSRDALDGGLLLTRDPQAPPRRCDLTLGPKGALALVADGMGGAAAGAIASEMAVAWIYRALLTGWGVDRNNAPQQFALRLREAVEATNTRIHAEAQANPEYHGMGTTATAAGLLDGFLYLAQVGDSRAYLVRRGGITQLTRDQSFVQTLVEAGTLTEEEAERSVQGNMILQALGAQPAVRVDLTYQELRRGDVVILCSDGLPRAVRKDELAEAATRIDDPDALCAELIDLANQRGGPDNVTVIAARVDGPGLDEPMDGDVVGRNEYVLEEP